ncbi:hypothetical protein V6N12_050491 [Hibiscus sabdariffa]|uniref:ABC transporter domain-containing protein n=1 Tax=Hibiscus sabdariffa TaxID=183260 RepID=A0ABR2GCJ0_9ROSI
MSGRVKFHSGTVTYNNQPYSKSLKWSIGFVLQDDVAFPHLIVKETLTYSTLLRLPNTLTMQQKKERATSVISELGLKRCQNTVIGGTLFRGISGGERKSSLYFGKASNAMLYFSSMGCTPLIDMNPT